MTSSGSCQPIEASITAVGGYVPPDKLLNSDLEKVVETTDAWIRERTGIIERRILKDPSKATAYMAAEALTDACRNRGIHPSELDAIICATATPDMGFVSSAAIAAGMIGARRALSFDLQAACSGFVYALETGANFVRSGRYGKVAIIGADKMSSVLDYTDRNTCILFGDGAGAVILEPATDNNFIVDTVLGSDGVNGPDLLRIPGGGSLHPASQDTVRQREHFFWQEGQSVFKHAVRRMIETSVEVMRRNSLLPETVDHFIPHQANLRIIRAVAGRIGIPMDKVLVNVERYGNTTGATIPLCLWDFAHRFERGSKIVLCAFGGGFTWGATYLRWACDRTLPVSSGDQIRS